jgi:hypothetical protein
MIAFVVAVINSKSHNYVPRKSQKYLLVFSYQDISILESMVFCIAMQCSLEKAQRFGGRCGCHFQGQRVSQGRNRILLLFLVWLTL